MGLSNVGHSSVVERSAVNREAAGSIPVGHPMAVSSSRFRMYRSQRYDTGSNPVAATRTMNNEKVKQYKTTWQHRARTKLKVRVLEYLIAHPCVDCSEGDPVVLTFDHVKGEKINGIAEMVNARKPWSIIEAEIEKCEVRCANCHVRKTANQLNYWKGIGII